METLGDGEQERKGERDTERIIIRLINVTYIICMYSKDKYTFVTKYSLIDKSNSYSTYALMLLRLILIRLILTEGKKSHVTQV